HHRRSNLVASISRPRTHINAPAPRPMWPHRLNRHTTETRLPASRGWRATAIVMATTAITGAIKTTTTARIETTTVANADGRPVPGATTPLGRISSPADRCRGKGPTPTATDAVVVLRVELQLPAPGTDSFRERIQQIRTSASLQYVP